MRPTTAATGRRVRRTAAVLEEVEALVRDQHHVLGLRLLRLAPLGRGDLELLELDQPLREEVAGDLVGDGTPGVRTGPRGDDLAADLVRERVEQFLALGRGDHHRLADGEALVEVNEGLLGDGHHEAPGLLALLLRLAGRGHGRSPRGGVRPVVGGKGRDCAHFYLAFLCVYVCTTHLDE